MTETNQPPAANNTSTAGAPAAVENTPAPATQAAPAKDAPAKETAPAASMPPVAQEGQQSHPQAPSQQTGEAKAQETVLGGGHEIELKFPEGAQIDGAKVQAFQGLVKKLGLKSDQAQALADFYVAAGPYSHEIRDQQAQKWAQAVKSDRELGGQNFERTVRLSRLAMAKYGDAEVRKLLDETGLGNHPALIRLMVRAGQPLQEDSIGSTGSAPPSSNQSREAWRKFYKNTPGPSR